MARVTLRTLYASPDRTIQPGETADLDADEAAALVAGGYAQPVDASPRRRGPEGTPPPPPPQGGGGKPLDKMTVAQLQDYADEHDISLPPDAKKADLVAAIVAAEQERAGG